MTQTYPHNEKDIAQAKSDLEYLQLQELLPPLMKYKLKYLQAIIEKSHPPDSITQQISESERISLEQMPRQAQISIFVSTIKCISGKEIIIYIANQKAYLLKQKTFFKWQKCYINCDSDQLKLTKDSKTSELIQQLQIQKLFISKTFKSYKKKIIFGIYHNNVKYIIGFNEQKTCQRVHSTMYRLIKEKRQYKFSKFRKEDEKELFSLGLESKKVQELIHSQEMQFNLHLEEKIKNFDIERQQNFKLLKNLESGRIMQDPSTGNLKINMLIKNTNPSLICQNYLKMNLWNKNINIFKIVTKVRNNSYICYLKTNKYSYVSYPRECYFSVIFYPYEEPQNNQQNIKTFYLLLESIKWQQEQNSGAVPMDFHQLLQIKIDYNKNITLVSFSTKAHFKGYCSISDNSAMLVHLFNDISSFNQQNDKPEEMKWFEFNVQPAKLGLEMTESQKDLSLPTDRNQTFDEQFQFSETKSEINSHPVIYKKTNIAKEVVIADKNIINSLFNVLKGEKDEDIINFIKNKSYYHYFLKQKFTNNQQFLQTDSPISKDFLLQNNKWKLQNGQYFFVDEKILNSQKDIVKMIMKQLGMNLMSGKSIMNMSLPVQIFSKKSMLDAIADGFGFLPCYLEKIKLNDDPIQEMKLIVSAFAFIQYTNPNIEKPFNPILGQTFQGRVGNLPIYLQQISHHPPISSLYIKSEDLQIHGDWDINISIGLNSAVSTMRNLTYVKLLKKKRQYIIRYANLQIGGLMYGNRSWKVQDKSFFYEKHNHLFCQISVGKYKKKVYQSSNKIASSDLTGGIFKVKKQFGNKFLNLDTKKSFSGIKPEDILQTCSFLQGKYYGDLSFNNIVYKSITEGPFPQRIFKNKYLLPSDAIFRQDIVYRIWQQYDSSNSQKQKLQNLQRKDRKLREKYKI